MGAFRLFCDMRSSPLRSDSWLASKFLPENSEHQQALSFLLDHPRRYYPFSFETPIIRSDDLKLVHIVSHIRRVKREKRSDGWRESSKFNIDGNKCLVVDLEILDDLIDINILRF